MLQCDRAELPLLIRSADVAVPLMSRLDAQVQLSVRGLLPAQPKVAPDAVALLGGRLAYACTHMAAPPSCPCLQLLRSAERLKLIIQYGVGVEGIDMQTVSAPPSQGCGISIATTGPGWLREAACPAEWINVTQLLRAASPLLICCSLRGAGACTSLPGDAPVAASPNRSAGAAVSRARCIQLQ